MNKSTLIMFWHHTYQYIYKYLDYHRLWYIFIIKKYKHMLNNGITNLKNIYWLKEFFNYFGFFYKDYWYLVNFNIN